MSLWHYVFMDLTKIKDIYASPNYNSKIVVAGWVRAFRGNRFIELNDGSTIQNIQCVITDSNLDTKKINVFLIPFFDRYRCRRPSSIVLKPERTKSLFRNLLSSL